MNLMNRLKIKASTLILETPSSTMKSKSRSIRIHSPENVVDHRNGSGYRCRYGQILEE